MGHGKHNGQSVRPNGVSPHGPMVTLGVAFALVQAQRHRAALLSAAARHLERDFMSTDVGPPRYKIAGAFGVSEPAREDVVLDLASELRRRAEEERAEAGRLLRLVLLPGQLKLNDASTPIESMPPDADAELNHEIHERARSHGGRT